ncbi:MAG: IctB family putative bicarbonate transporter [Cyanobacteriota bacterium]|nr:IctB family putative bicarbonate transporter [Cyanobacteriota bacterium]
MTNDKGQMTWQQLTLSNLPAYEWRKGSFLLNGLSFISRWRAGSWLLADWGEAIGALLISLVLGLGPFVSTALIGVLLLAVGGYWALITLADEGNPAAITPIHYTVLAYWSMAAIATVLSPVKTAALSGLIKLTLYLFLFVLAARVLRNPRLRNWTIAVLLLVSLVVSAYGVRQEFFGVDQLATWNDPTSELADDTRVYSYLGNPNLLAGYLLAAIALSIVAFIIWRGWLPKALAAVMFGVNLACLFYTDSRGGWLAALAALAVLGVLLYFWWRSELPRFWQIWTLPIAFGSCAVLLLIAIATVEPLRLRVMSIFAGRGDSSNNFRINVWDAVFRMIGDYPLFGIGPGNGTFNAIYPRYMETGFTALSAYSIFLETIVEMGFVGFAVFMWMLVVTLNQCVQQLNRLYRTRHIQAFWLMGATAAIAGFLTHGLVDTVWYRPQINCLWWLMVALVASFWQPPTAIDSGEKWGERIEY